MDSDEDVDPDKLFPVPKLLHRVTEFLPENLQEETSLYFVPYEEGRYRLEQVTTFNDWLIARDRVDLHLKLLKVLLPHFERIVKTE